MNAGVLGIAFRVILLLVALGALAAAFLLFSPFYLAFESALHDMRHTMSVRFFWIHPWFLRVSYSSRDREFASILFGRFRVARQSRDEYDAEGPAADSGGDEQAKDRGGAAQEGAAEKPDGPHGLSSELPPEAQPETRPGAMPLSGEPPISAQTEGPHESPTAAGERTRDTKEEPPDEAGAPGDAEKQERKSLRQRLSENKVLFVLRQTRLRRKALSCVSKVLRSTLHLVRFDRFMVRVRAGSSDPVAPGIAYGCFVGLRNSLALHHSSHVSLELEPVFDEGEVIEWESSVRAQSSVARLLFPFLVALVTFPYLSAFVTWRRMKKRGML